MSPMFAVNLVGEPVCPVLASPKLDGIRCLIINGIALTRSLKPVPNKYIQSLFSHKKFSGLDGELIVGSDTASDVFQVTDSGVMSIQGEPDVRFHVFDDFSDNISFKYRLLNAHNRIKKLPNFIAVEHHEAKTYADLVRYEEDFLTRGYEGLMLRNPDGLYKHGRSTLREGGLLKMKRFLDSEAIVIYKQALRKNTNEGKRNELGHLERSTKKVGMVEQEMLGGLWVRDLKTGVEFSVGSGFTEAQRLEFWRQDLKNRLIKYKYQPTGVKEKPRFPVFLGFRSLEDM